MTAKAVMARSLDIIEAVTDIFRETNGEIAHEVKQQYERQVKSVRDSLEYLHEIQQVEQSTSVDAASIGPFRDCINYLSHDLVPPLSKMVEASGKQSELGHRVQQVWADTQSVSRTVDLLGPHVSETLEPTLKWMVHEGMEVHVGWLTKIKDQIPSELSDLSALAARQMGRRVSERYDPDQSLQIFFGLNQTEFADVIGDVDWTSKLPDSLHEYSPVRVLELIKEKLDKISETGEANRWLSNPIQALKRKAPIEAIKDGRAFEVLQIVIGIEEGIPD
jgi:hypothetical protein